MKKKREVSCDPISCSFKMKVVLSVVITHVRIYKNCASDVGKTHRLRDQAKRWLGAKGMQENISTDLDDSHFKSLFAEVSKSVSRFSLSLRSML